MPQPEREGSFESGTSDLGSGCEAHGDGVLTRREKQQTSWRSLRDGLEPRRRQDSGRRGWTQEKFPFPSEIFIGSIISELVVRNIS